LLVVLETSRISEQENEKTIISGHEVFNVLLRRILQMRIPADLLLVVTNCHPTLIQQQTNNNRNVRKNLKPSKSEIRAKS